MLRFSKIIFIAALILSWLNSFSQKNGNTFDLNKKRKYYYSLNYSFFFDNSRKHPSRTPNDEFDYMVKNSFDIGMPVSWVGMTLRNQQTYAFNAMKLFDRKRFLFGVGIGYSYNSFLLVSEENYLSDLENLRANYTQSSVYPLPEYLEDSIWTQAVKRKAISNFFSISFLGSLKFKYDFAVNVGTSLSFLRLGKISYRSESNVPIVGAPEFKISKSFWDYPFPGLLSNTFLNISKEIYYSEKFESNVFLGLESQSFNGLLFQFGINLKI